MTGAEVPGGKTGVGGGAGVGSAGRGSTGGGDRADGFRVLGRADRFAGQRISVSEVMVEAPDGGVFSREIVRHPGAVAVVAVSPASVATVVDGQPGDILATDDPAALDVFLVRQFRAAFGGEVLEIPAGTLDVEGETPEAAAYRELEEEVGQVAGGMERLGEIYNSPGICDERTFVFLATGLSQGARAGDGPEERYMSVVRMPVAQAVERCLAGEIHDAQTVVGLLLARDRLFGGTGA